ncbi:MAG: Glu/Leu/Phe/Val dehydrogenase dimerization domain-containing protein [Nitrospirota bacterium]
MPERTAAVRRTHIGDAMDSIENMTAGLSIAAELSGGGRAFVVVDSLYHGTSSGGVRVAENIELGEVQALAREMTLKFRFIGLPRGGAKSGIRMPAGLSPDGKRRLLEEVGRRYAPLIQTGLYYPGMDMNCGPDDLRALYRGAGIALGAVTDTSYFTALSVANAVIACSDVLAGDGRPLTVAIEGFGSVGRSLAERLPAERFRIVAVSTMKGAAVDRSRKGFSAPLLSSLRREFGDDCVSMIGGARTERERLLEAEVDILLPSARTWVIDENTARNVRARCIVPIANAPYTKEAVGLLHERGVVCLPGFVTNSGGVYASSLYDSGVPGERIEQISATLYRRIVGLLVRKAAELRQSPVVLAEAVALERLRRAHEGHGQGQGSAGLVRRIGKLLRRKGIVPRAWHARAFEARFINNLEQLLKEIEEK